MSLTSARLVLGAEELPLFDAANRLRQDLMVQKYEIGSPAVREASKVRTDADGTDDSTTRHGARAVTIELRVFDTPAALIDRIARFTHPRSRPYLYMADDEWPGGERRLLLRADQWSSPREFQTSDRLRDVALSWTAPSGIWESGAPTEIMVLATDEDRVGITFPTTFPLVFAGTAGTGQALVDNPGTTWSDQVVRLYGPCRGPRWFNDSTGEVMAFGEDLVIPLGEYVELNTRNRTAYYLSDPNADRLGMLDFELSTWWQVPPGQSTVRYAPMAGVDAGCAAALGYRPAYL